MKLKTERLHGAWGILLAVLIGSMPVPAKGHAQTVDESLSIENVMLSDLHFDPFHDPLKVPELAKAPVDQWERILQSRDLPHARAAFAALREQCPGKDDVDASYTLLASSLKAAKARAPEAKFVSVSGDLIVHDLDCKYRAAMKLQKAVKDDQSVSADFAQKTFLFVVKRVEAKFAGRPVYIALGNNDSRCNHNRMDVRDQFLKTSGLAIIEGLVGVSSAERRVALATYNTAGYYAVTMPAPMRRTRLLVIDDTYMMPTFTNCEADDTDQMGSRQQMAWLEAELESARKEHKLVWVLGHLPPAVDPDRALEMGKSFCSKGEVSTHQSSPDLANLLAKYGDVVKLALFGHTHMDEFHLLRAQGAGVPVKVVSSVSPVDGNAPSFTIGRVDPRSGVLVDYTVYVESGTTDERTTWNQEYAFDETFGQSAFTAVALSNLIGNFRADPDGTSSWSRLYQRHYRKGAAPSGLASHWAGYVCSLDHAAADTFKACVCEGF